MQINAKIELSREHQEFFYCTFDTGKFLAGFLMTASK
jgi:hypothetical protein